AVGMTGAHTTGSKSRPKGVLFFAGPSGVGKTMMAKKIAKLVFGNSEAYLRFDMSEFRGEHSGDRLIGAPPGYVGHDEGGELTNAIREQPFRVLLFDEIEKADPGILDKFLQILEDGRLTDGRGQTVYFSKSLIIFTSNAGIMDTTKDPAVRLVFRADQEADPDAYRAKVDKGVKSFFENRLGRPELYNRIGDNIVVFNYITPPVAAQILKDMLAIVSAHASEARRIEVEFSDDAVAGLIKALHNDDKWLDNSGRGVGNLVEAMVVNPLSRFMFDNAVPDESKIIVAGLGAADGDGEPGRYQINASVES
ncbi:MAG: AAA family ATPase, partial [Woeseiaceae bacterium]|nr:AAA family ATPase [Woeseiaceae bacterium]